MGCRHGMSGVTFPVTCDGSRKPRWPPPRTLRSAVREEWQQAAHVHIAPTPVLGAAHAGWGEVVCQRCCSAAAPTPASCARHIFLEHTLKKETCMQRPPLSCGCPAHAHTHARTRMQSEVQVLEEKPRMDMASKFASQLECCFVRESCKA